MTKSRGINRPKAKWTPEQIEQVRTRYPHEKTEKIAADIGMTLQQVYRKSRLMGLEKTAEYLASPDACRLRRGGNVGEPYRYHKGHIPANKGKRTPGYAPGRMAESQFKKGQKSHTWKPIGTERLSKEGYLQRKLFDTGVTRRDYIPVHHIIWKEAGNEIPQGYRLTFKDGNKANITLANLELVSVADMMKRNTIHNYPKEVVEIVQLRGAVQRQINKRSKQNEQ